MSYCQKCIDFFKVYAEERGWDIYPYTPPVTIVPESECEFWAHKELNKIKSRYSRRGGYPASTMVILDEASGNTRDLET